MLRRRLATLSLGIAFALPGPAVADLYRWTDADGRLHVTDDLSRVPAEHRALATQPRASRSTWTHVDPAAPSEAAAPEGEETRRHRIPVQRAGLELAVTATLNGRTRAGFKVDTGATINTIPRRVVDELGLSIDDTTPVTFVSGISGEPMMVPVVTLREVRLRGASVENVEMAVLDTLEYGLLGMPYFNHFRVQMDPARGVLTLEEIDLATVEGVYGGYGEGYWRSRFSMMREMLERHREARTRVPSTHTGVLEKLASSERYWREQYDQLESKASRAGVPRAWRD